VNTEVLAITPGMYLRSVNPSGVTSLMITTEYHRVIAAVFAALLSHRLSNLRRLRIHGSRWFGFLDDRIMDDLWWIPEPITKFLNSPKCNLNILDYVPSSDYTRRILWRDVTLTFRSTAVQSSLYNKISANRSLVSIGSTHISAGVFGHSLSIDMENLLQTRRIQDHDSFTSLGQSRPGEGIFDLVRANATRIRNERMLWMRLAVVIACTRANRNSMIWTSIFALMPQIDETGYYTTGIRMNIRMNIRMKVEDCTHTRYFAEVTGIMYNDIRSSTTATEATKRGTKRGRIGL